MSDLSLPKRGKLECTKKKLTFDNNFYFCFKRSLSCFNQKFNACCPKNY